MLIRPDTRRAAVRSKPDDDTAVFDLGPVEDTFSGGRALVTVGPDELPVLIVRTRRGFFAMENLCPHQQRRLDDAVVRGRRIRCAFHAREYDLTTGACRSPRSGPRLRVFRCWA